MTTQNPSYQPLLLPAPPAAPPPDPPPNPDELPVIEQQTLFGDPVRVTASTGENVHETILVEYKGQVYESDPGATFEEVRAAMIDAYPELANSTTQLYTRPEDGREVTRFVVYTGEKGAGRASPAVKAGPTGPDNLVRLLARRLLTLAEQTPAHYNPWHIMETLYNLHQSGALQADLRLLVALQPDIEAAIARLDRVAKRSQRMVNQCRNLSAIPCRRAPIGF